VGAARGALTWYNLRMTVTIRSLTLSDLDRGALRRELTPGHAVKLTDLDGAILIRPEDIPALANDLAQEEELLGDMASLEKESTGVDHVVFVSTKAGARHAARIKIAVDPPDSFNAADKTASMAVHDFSIVGAYISPHIVEQAKRFIETNREVFLLYWETKIGTKEMINRLKVPPGA
jgi:hypothetical protein